MAELPEGTAEYRALWLHFLQKIDGKMDSVENKTSDLQSRMAVIEQVSKDVDETKSDIKHLLSVKEEHGNRLTSIETKGNILSGAISAAVSLAITLIGIAVSALLHK